MISLYLHRKNKKQGTFARMAELVDALVSGTSVLSDVQVRVLFRAQIIAGIKSTGFPFFNYLYSGCEGREACPDECNGIGKSCSGHR